MLIKYKSDGCWGSWRVKQTITALNAPLKNKKVVVFESICLNLIIWFAKNWQRCVAGKDFFRAELGRYESWIMGVGKKRSPSSSAV